MIKDALEFFAGLVSKSTGFHSIKLPDGSTKICEPGGDVTWHLPDRPAFDDRLSTIPSMIEWLEVQRFRLENDDPDREPQIFIAPDYVMAVARRFDNYKPDRASMALNRSRAFALLAEWIDTPISQIEVVRALRGPLAGCVSEGLVGVFRSIEFKNQSATRANLTHGADSFGREVHREALSKGQELPETIVFNLPLYQFDGCPNVTIAVAIDIDYDAQRIRLLPVGDSVQRAFDTTLNAIHAQFLSNNPAANVYFGYPGLPIAKS